MIGKCNGLSDAEVDAHRGAAFREFAVGRAWPDRTAGLAVIAIQPFDAVEPIDRDWEINTRLAAMAFWRQLRTLHDPEAVAFLAREVLRGYRETAIATGEPYYAGRYDELLNATERTEDTLVRATRPLRWRRKAPIRASGPAEGM